MNQESSISDLRHSQALISIPKFVVIDSLVIINNLLTTNKLSKFSNIQCLGSL